jgi:hypothetical protein
MANDNFYYIFTSMSDYRWGFELDIGFIDHSQVVTSNISNTIAISTLYKITLCFSACSVFTSSFSLGYEISQATSVIYLNLLWRRCLFGNRRRNLTHSSSSLVRFTRTLFRL